MITESPLVAEAAASCEPIASDALSERQADDLARSLKALADPTRLRIVSIIAGAPEGEACVCDITDAFDLGQPTVSHHLKVLLDAGYLARSKRGTWAYYRLVPGALDALSRVFATS